MEQYKNDLIEVVDKAQKYDELIKFQNGFNILRCSFCGKGQDDVTKLIAGNNVYICDECVEVCTEVLKESK